MNQHTDFNVMDILVYVLPLESTNAGVWQQLSAEETCSLKQSCRVGRQLADLHTTSASHAVPYDADQPDEWSDFFKSLDPEPEEELQQPPDEATRRAAWLVGAELEMANRCRSLARLHNLSSLKVTAQGEDFPAAMARFGIATAGSVTALDLAGATLSAPASDAIRLACPRLRSLVLSSSGQVDGPALESLQGLEQLHVRDYRELPEATLDSLGRLAGLHELDMSTSCFNLTTCPRALQSWTGLANLRSCKVDMEYQSDLITLAHIAPVLTLTQLTRLEWLHIHHDWHQDDLPDDVAAALSLLAGLVRLEALALGERFIVTDAASAAIRPLTRLTSLGFARTRLELPTPPGRLPALQRLALRGHYLTPHEVLQSLLPHMPLACLTQLSCECSAQSDTCHASFLDLCVDGGGEWDQQPAVGLRQVADTLAALPRLVVRDVRLLSRAWGARLTLDEMGRGLQPLGPHLVRLRLLVMRRLLPLLGDWRVLGAALPHLRRLDLQGWRVSDEGMEALGVHVTALRQLSVERCTGMTEQGWLRLAAAAPGPLAVYAEGGMRAGLSDSVAVQCVAEAERVQGRPCTFAFQHHHFA